MQSSFPRKKALRNMKRERPKFGVRGALENTTGTSRILRERKKRLYRKGGTLRRGERYVVGSFPKKVCFLSKPAQRGKRGLHSASLVPFEKGGGRKLINRKKSSPYDVLIRDKVRSS